MPSLNNTTDGFNSGHPRRNYITTSAFNNDFYLYTVTRNPTTYAQTGTLSAVVGATAANCPADRILRENGRRLYKDANPGISTLLVGVYDSVSGLSGLIDPNSALFAVYNGDKSVFQDNGVDPNGGTLDQGPPIYTRGTVTAIGGFNVATTTSGVTTTVFSASPTGAITTTGGLTVSAGASINIGAPSTVAGTATTATFDLATANVFIHSTTVTGPVTYTIQNSSIGSIFYFRATCDGTTRAISFSGGTFASSVTTLPLSLTTLVTVIRTA